MNYRHLFHAGNFADCLKHAILARIVTYMKRKDKAFRVVDTHAGIGLYDLSSDKAQKTGEWKDGIGKLMAASWSKKSAELLAPYFDCITELNPDYADKGIIKTYPGSPKLARMLMRKQDRLTATELHPDDFEDLKANFEGDYQARITQLDAWHVLKSHMPPKEKRGVVLVDPAFEAKGDFFRMVRGANQALERFATGTYCFWYPIKEGLEMREFNADMTNVVGAPNTISVELWVKDTRIALNGSGMVIINPPYTLVNELRTILPEMSKILAQSEDFGWRVRELVADKT